MHGYDAAVDPDMFSVAVFWRYPRPIGGLDLGHVHSLRLHATAAAVLGVKPAETACHNPVFLGKRE